MLSGIYVALVTPFKDGKIDFAAFERYVSHVISAAKISGVVVCGSTGESLMLTQEEKKSLISTAARVVDGKVKLFAGIIESSQDAALDIMRNTENLVDGFLCICPYYIKPSQEQLYGYFSTISAQTEKSIILYNNPGRCGVSIEWDCFNRLVEINNIVAIKECASDLTRFALWRKNIKGQCAFLSGNDDAFCGALAMGADGVISVSANIATALYVRMYCAYQEGDFERFAVLRDSLAPLHSLLFKEPSPAPVKYALSKMGLMTDEVRAPLTSLSSALKSSIDGFLEQNGFV